MKRWKIDASSCFEPFELLADNPLKCFKLDPRSLSGRHLEFLFARWEQRAQAGTLSPSSMQKFHSHLRTFTGWIGKPGLVKSLSAYLEDRALYSRRYAATESKTWRARDVDPRTVIEAVAAYDENAAASLYLMSAFGLRFKEAVMLRPHVDVVTAAQAGKPEHLATHYLHTRRGTKGGRLRFVPIDTPERLQAINRARRVAPSDDDSVSNARLSLVQAIRHLRYVMERFQISKAGLEVVPHGLRHQYASDEYFASTGNAPPVEGGAWPLPNGDMAARLDVAEKLGHGRAEIASAYLGPRRQPSALPAVAAVTTPERTQRASD